MKKFIIDISVMAGIFILVNFLFYIFITYEVLYKDYEFSDKKLSANRIFNKVILSDSHGWKLTDEYPEIGEKFESHGIINLSYGSDSYGDCLIKLNWLLKKNIKIDTILLTVDDHMITKKSNNMERSIFYSNPELHKKVYGISYFKFYYYSVSRLFPILNSSNQTLISKYLESKFVKSNSESNFETTWNLVSLEEKREMINDRMKVFFPDEKYSPNKKLNENLQEIVRVCRENEIVLVGVKFPIDQMLINEFNKINAMNKVKNRADELGVGIFFDYQYRFNDIKFLGNQDHVNAIGADSVSNAIIRELGH